jgi:hypothetical protein
MRDKNGEELVTVRTEGGPFPGDRFIPISKLGGWPPQEKLEAPGGSYLKVKESNLPEATADHPHISRGAIYKWESAT